MPSRVSWAISTLSLSSSRFDFLAQPVGRIFHRLLGLHLQDEVHPTLQVKAEIHLLGPRQDAGKQGWQALHGEDTGDDVVSREQREHEQQDDATADPFSHRTASKNDARAKGPGAGATPALARNRRFPWRNCRRTIPGCAENAIPFRKRALEETIPRERQRRSASSGRPGGRPPAPCRQAARTRTCGSGAAGPAAPLGGRAGSRTPSIRAPRPPRNWRYSTAVRETSSPGTRIGMPGG